jgi:hypothetical protein
MAQAVGIVTNSQPSGWRVAQGGPGWHAFGTTLSPKPRTFKPQSVVRYTRAKSMLARAAANEHLPSFSRTAGPRGGMLLAPPSRRSQGRSNRHLSLATPVPKACSCGPRQTMHLLAARTSMLLAHAKQMTGVARTASPRLHERAKNMPPLILPRRPCGVACFLAPPSRRSQDHSNRQLPLATPVPKACSCGMRQGSAFSTMRGGMLLAPPSRQNQEHSNRHLPLATPVPKACSRGARLAVRHFAVRTNMLLAHAKRMTGVARTPNPRLHVSAQNLPPRIFVFYSRIRQPASRLRHGATQPLGRGNPLPRHHLRRPQRLGLRRAIRHAARQRRHLGAKAWSGSLQ